MNGWMGKIIKIDLSSGNKEIVQIDEQMRRKYIGARGLGVKLFTKFCEPKIDPLSAENVIIFLTGPLTGLVQTAGRYQVISNRLRERYLIPVQVEFGEMCSNDAV